IYVPMILHFMYILHDFLKQRVDCAMLKRSTNSGFAKMQSQLSGWRRHMLYFSVELLKYVMLLQAG
ncbi:hypothetical protein RYX36_034421, partial [Vicia faba]